MILFLSSPLISVFHFFHYSFVDEIQNLSHPLLLQLLLTIDSHAQPISNRIVLVNLHEDRKLLRTLTHYCVAPYLFISLLSLSSTSEIVSGMEAHDVSGRQA